MRRSQTLPLPCRQQYKERGGDEASGKEKVEEDEKQNGRAVKFTRMDTESGLKMGNEETTSGRLLVAINPYLTVMTVISIFLTIPLIQFFWRGKNAKTVPSWFDFIWTCHGLLAFCIGELNLLCLLDPSRWKPDRRRRALEEQEDYTVSSRDKNLWYYLAYGVSNSLDVIYGASIHEESVQRSGATFGAWASFLISCLAIYGHAGGFRDVYSHRINRYTKSRQALWWMLFIISGAAVGFSKFAGPRV